MTTQLLAAALGISLAAAPAWLEHGRWELSIAQIAGPLIASSALVAASEVMRGLRWLTATLGLGLILAEAVLGTKGNAGVYGAVSGLLVVLLSIVPGSRRHSYAGGWRCLR